MRDAERADGGGRRGGERAPGTCLLECEELQDGEIHGGVEAEPALVRADRRGVLHAVPAVHPHVAGVVQPRHPEAHDALRLHHPLEKRVVRVLWRFGEERPKRVEDFEDRLLELAFVRVAHLDDLKDLVDDARDG